MLEHVADLKDVYFPFSLTVHVTVYLVEPSGIFLFY